MTIFAFVLLFIALLAGAIIPPLTRRVDFWSWIIAYGIVVSLLGGAVISLYDEYGRDDLSRLPPRQHVEKAP